MSLTSCPKLCPSSLSCMVLMHVKLWCRKVGVYLPISYLVHATAFCRFKGSMAEVDIAQPLVSMLDICVLGGVAAACLYFFVFRQKKKPEPAEFKRLAPM